MTPLEGFVAISRSARHPSPTIQPSACLSWTSTTAHRAAACPVDRPSLVADASVPSDPVPSLSPGSTARCPSRWRGLRRLISRPIARRKCIGVGRPCPPTLVECGQEFRFSHLGNDLPLGLVRRRQASAIACPVRELACPICLGVLACPICRQHFRFDQYVRLPLSPTTLDEVLDRFGLLLRAVVRKR